MGMFNEVLVDFPINKPENIKFIDGRFQTKDIYPLERILYKIHSDGSMFNMVLGESFKPEDSFYMCIDNGGDPNKPQWELYDFKVTVKDSKVLRIDYVE